MVKKLKELKHKGNEAQYCQRCKTIKASLRINAILLNRENGVCVLSCKRCLESSEKKLRSKMQKSNLIIIDLWVENYNFMDSNANVTRFDITKEKLKAQQFSSQQIGKLSNVEIEEALKHLEADYKRKKVVYMDTDSYEILLRK